MASELMSSSSVTFKPETVEAFRKIYTQHKESIDYKVRFGRRGRTGFRAYSALDNRGAVNLEREKRATSGGQPEKHRKKLMV